MQFHGRRVTVMGLGRFGGGVGAVRFLVGQGADVTVTDLQSADELADSLAEIDGIQVRLHLGGHREEDFRGAELIVVSPAVPEESPFLQFARDAGVPVTTEMNLFWERNRGRTVCVTGTNGKSTTTALIHALLSASGKRCWLGGNIGRSLLPVVTDILPEDWVVLELSSFQLERLAALQPRPDVAVVTNFAPNHLDRHRTIDAYRLAKQNLLRWQWPSQAAVLNQDDAEVAQWPARGRTYWFGVNDACRDGLFLLPPERGTGRSMLFRSGQREQAFALPEPLPLPGRHNLQNILAATCAAFVAGASPAAIGQGLVGFRPLPHRLETVAEVEGGRYVNDSKATTPEAAALAIEAFDAPVILLAGGYDKGVDLTPMIEAMLRKPVKAAALLGPTGPAIERLLTERDPGGGVPHRCCSSLAEGFAWAVSQSQPGDVILLSPGCASYDAFRNYEERGAAFAELVRQASGASHGPVTACPQDSFPFCGADAKPGS